MSCASLATAEKTRPPILIHFRNIDIYLQPVCYLLDYLLHCLDQGMFDG